MDKNIKKFVEFENPNVSYKKLSLIMFALVTIILFLVYFISYRARWLFYSLLLSSLILFFWGILVLVKPKNTRKNYYLFAGILKINCSFAFLHFAYSTLTTTLYVPLWFYGLICFVMACIFICCFSYNKKLVEKDMKMEIRKPLPVSFVSIALVCFIGKVIAKPLANSWGTATVLIIASVPLLFVSWFFLFVSTLDFLKYKYICEPEKS